MTEEMLTSFLANPASCASLGDPDVPVSEDNEQKACMFFETRCKLLLRAYGASLEEDLAQLSTADTSYHRKCALLLRRAEMKMLTQAVENVALRALDEEL
eukprot:m.885961 g.885961  ORF g.885961 m.885961 type:complete len:100 (+) comp23623_c1_seq2:252-551(+)